MPVMMSPPVYSKGITASIPASTIQSPSTSQPSTSITKSAPSPPQDTTLKSSPLMNPSTTISTYPTTTPTTYSEYTYSNVSPNNNYMMLLGTIGVGLFLILLSKK